MGCLARSVRDVARYFDVAAGFDHHDPTSLPKVDGWERDLGSRELQGLRVVVDPTFGGVAIGPATEHKVMEAAEALIRDLRLRRVDARVTVPRVGAAWMLSNVIGLFAELEHDWPACASQLTDEIRIGLQLSRNLLNMPVAAEAERLRRQVDWAMAELFSQADIVITATNPSPAFPAQDGMSDDSGPLLDLARDSRAGQAAFSGALKALRIISGFAPGVPRQVLDAGTSQSPGLLDMGALTMPANLSGNPAISIPAGESGGLPIGMQIIARHHDDGLLLDLAQHVERERPWPLVAPPQPNS